MSLSLAGIRGVVFDLDDTLYPELDFTRGGLAAAAAALAERFSLDARDVEAALEGELAAVLAGTAETGHIFDNVLEAYGLPADQETIVWLLSTYRGHAPALAPYPDVVPTIEALRGSARGGAADTVAGGADAPADGAHAPTAAAPAKVGLITDGPVDVQRAKFAALDIERFFDAVIFTDELGAQHGKPSELPYETMEAALALPGAALVYVADNPAKDFVGARARRWKTLRIRRPAGLHSRAEPRPGYEPDAEIQTLAELPALLVDVAKPKLPST